VGELVRIGAEVDIEGVVLVDLAVHTDARGSFVETFRQAWLGDRPPMVQTNLSTKQRGALVGMHYHLLQADWWTVVEGRARVALCDLRVSSPTEGRTWVGELSWSEPRGLYIPPGVAHGFVALEDMRMLYQVDHYYDGGDELGVAWDDPDLGIDWGVSSPVLSQRDLGNPRRRDLAAEALPLYPDANPKAES